MNDIGVLEHSQKAWQKTLSTSARGYIWLETNTPVYYVKTVEACKPYLQLSKDVFIMTMKKACVLYENMREYVTEKTPVVVAAIDQYTPGLIDNIHACTLNGFVTIKKYFNDYYFLTAEYFKTKVFV